MTVDPSVTAALETAVAADPRNVALRVHLASLLLLSGDAGRALEHAQAALTVEPDHTEALVSAGDALTRAAARGGRRLLEADVRVFTRKMRAEATVDQHGTGLGEDRVGLPSDSDGGPTRSVRTVDGCWLTVAWRDR